MTFNGGGSIINKPFYISKAIVGGTLIGFYSSYFGRKLCIIISCIGAGAFIPLWVYGPNIQGVQAGSFMLQFFVQVRQ